MQESQKLHAIFEKLHRKPRDAANGKKSSRLQATLDKGNLLQKGLVDVQTLKHEYLRKRSVRLSTMFPPECSNKLQIPDSCSEKYDISNPCPALQDM